MKDKKKLAFASIIAGYTLATAFIVLIFANQPSDEIVVAPKQEELFVEKVTEGVKISMYGSDRIAIPQGAIYTDSGFKAVDSDGNDISDQVLISGVNEVDTGKAGFTYKIEYTHINNNGDETKAERFVTVNGANLNVNSSVVYKDHLDGVIVNDTDPIVAVVGNDPLYIDRDVIRGDREVVIDDTYRIGAVEGGIGGNDYIGTDRVHRRDHHRTRIKEDVYDKDVDLGLLDRRIAEQDLVIDDTKEKFGLNKDGVNLANLTVANNRDDAELGEVNLNFNDNKNGTFGLNKGELFAYNFPSQGVGAGVGNGSIGAGSGAGAGLSAGIGEAVYNGETVPTLGGVGTYKSAIDPTETIGGVGGLISGAGAGTAAGLVNGIVKPQLGVPGIVAGVGVGNNGYGGKQNYDLPQDGALHIMMHVDGSGSILNTRKQLEIMKNTLLKKELLPYYNNDENLYNKRVTIVDGNGERTLQFFAEAAKKDNVLALVFQDEAQPAYHLPNFNKKPEDHYMDDLSKLKNKLNGYGGLYRGIMFQVDRGNTFAKSFKEFVENAFQGTGYLEKDNLKKYYYQDNQRNIQNKNGILFCDEYHIKDEGDPHYYMNLILNASKKIGIDLKAKGAGLSDGRYNKKSVE